MNNFEIDVIVEIPLSSMYKYEVDKKTGGLAVDRPLPYPLPYNYGYAPGTLHEDGDPLDVCIIGAFPIHPLAKVKVVVIGAFICDDNGESDDKLVAVVSGETPEHHYIDRAKAIQEVKKYLTSYKAGFLVKNYVDADEAYAILMKDVEAYLNEQNS